MKKRMLLPLAGAILAVPALAQQVNIATGNPTARWQRPDAAAMDRRQADDMAVVLGLTAQQRPLLDAFLARPQPHTPPASPPPGAAPLSFGEELDRMEQDVGRHLADERQHLLAARALYAALDARQKTVFDALVRLGHGGPDGPGGFGGPRFGLGDPHGPGRRDGPDGPPPPPAQ